LTLKTNRKMALEKMRLGEIFREQEFGLAHTAAPPAYEPAESAKSSMTDKDATPTSAQKPPSTRRKRDVISVPVEPDLPDEDPSPP
jgi:hypothetical protein